MAAWRIGVPAVTAALALLVTACGSGSGSGANVTVTATVVGAPGAGSGPALSITPPDGSQGVALNAPITVAARDGHIASVDLHAANDAAPVPGQVSADGTSWVSVRGLGPSAQYVVDATAVSRDGRTTQTHSSFATQAVRSKLTMSAQPDNGATVGIAMPVVLKFDQDVDPQFQAALVQHLSVRADPPVQGAWRWFGPDEVHFRPVTYWAPGTRVSVVADVRGVQANRDTWGVDAFATSFTVGEKHVSTVDTASHQMVVTRNDQVVATYPVSTGRPSLQTINGNLVVWTKTYVVTMDSQTIGIPRSSPDGYYEKVYWDTQISTDGFYVHAAPWSEESQGTDNVSHGCVNLTSDRAEQFYNFAQIGDLVIVTNSTRPASAADGEADWNMPFSQYANSQGQAPAPPNVPAASGRN